MANYIHLFETTSEFSEAYNGEGYGEPWVSYTLENTHVKYNKSEEERLKQTYLTFDVLSDGDITWIKVSLGSAKSIEYRKNGGEWTTITASYESSAPKITVTSGDVIEFKGDNDSYAPMGTSYFSRFGGTANFNVKGNIMSLINSTSFSELTELSGSNTFAGLFSGCTTVIDASKLLLPASTVPVAGYYAMFGNCTSLTTAPELPATAVSNYSYYSMFIGCTALTQAPELPATTLAQNCYNRMFLDCTSLTTAPELPATTLADYCYQDMFRNCASLTTAPSLPTTALTEFCYDGMFGGCTSLRQAPELPATALARQCYGSMFARCTSLTSGPTILPATDFSNAQSCYVLMFNGCTSLTTAPELPAQTVTNSAYDHMFQGCTSLNYIKCLATGNNIGPNYTSSPCYQWVANAGTSTGTFVKAASMNSWQRNNSGIPTGWTVVNA